MKNLILIISFILGISFLSQAQMAAFDSPYDTDYFHKNIYVEFGGSSVLGGIHYDMRLEKGRMDGPGFRIGVGGSVLALSFFGTLGVSSSMVVPIEYNYAFGKKNKYFLMGVGVLPAWSSSSTTTLFTEIHTTKSNATGAFFHLAYRYQPTHNGMFLQLSYVPVFIDENVVNPIAFGFSLGYGFK